MGTTNKNSALIMIVMLTLASGMLIAQDSKTGVENQLQVEITQVPIGQKMKVEGVIIDHEADDLILRSTGGGFYRIVVAASKIKEKKSNPFRGAKNYSKDDLVQGLQIEAKGVGDSSGSIFANEINFRHDDFLLAQTMDARVVPVETRLKDTELRLVETEQNAQRLSGQVRELNAITDIIRDSAKTAQTTADGAMSEAKNAKSLADDAKEGVQAANERITSLDAYDVKSTATVSFKLGSAVLLENEKTELDKFAEITKGEKGFLIEVTGFASSDGDEAFNRRLSQRRAEAVVQYLAENYSIPLRRFIMPMGYGEKNPIADNATIDGRKENRRVEVKILVSKGLISNENPAHVPGTNISAN